MNPLDFEINTFHIVNFFQIAEVYVGPCVKIVNYFSQRNYVINV